MAVTISSVEAWRRPHDNHCGQASSVYEDITNFCYKQRCRCGAYRTQQYNAAVWSEWSDQAKNVAKAAEPQEDALQHFINNL